MESKYKMHAVVTLTLSRSVKIRWCTICAIKQEDNGSIRYDLKVPSDTELGYTRMYDIDANLIEGIEVEANDIARSELTNI